jgi:PAS domain S-box-containing protein
LFAGVLLLTETRSWPWFVLAALPATFLFDWLKGTPPTASLGLFVADSSGALTGAWLVRRWVTPKPQLATLREYGGLLVGAALLGPILGATLGAAVLTTAGLSHSFWVAWRNWWGNTAMAISLLTPFILAWGAHPPWTAPFFKSRLKMLEAVLLTALLTVWTWHLLVADAGINAPYKSRLMPLLLWAGLRFGLRGATAANLWLALLMGFFTCHYLKGLTSAELASGAYFATLQSFLVVALLVTLIPTIVLRERNRKVEELQQSEERFQRLTQAAFEAILISEHGRICDLNDQCLDMFQRERGALMGADVLELVAPASRAPVLAAIHSGGDLPEGLQLRRGDGSVFWAEARAKSIRIGSRSLRITALRDVTQRVAQEQEIARLSRLYAALSQINQAIVHQPDRPELFARVCRIMVEFGGFPMAWIGGVDPETGWVVPIAQFGDDGGFLNRSVVDPDHPPAGPGLTGTAIREGKELICNDFLNDPQTQLWHESAARAGHRSSAVFPIREQDRVCGAITVFSQDRGFFQTGEIALLKEVAADVSFALDKLAEAEAHRQAEAAARNERVFSDMIIESMPGILYFYNEQGRFLRWNRNFEIVSGYSPEEMARIQPLDFFPDGEKGRLQQKIAEVFERGESCVEASFLTKNGGTIPYFFTGRRIRFNGVLCSVGMGIDISERKRAELELREIQGQLEAVIANLREGLVMADPGGGFLRWNPASLRLLGFADPVEGARRQREFGAIFELDTLDGARLPLEEWPLARVRRGESIHDLELRVRRLHSDWERIFNFSGSLVSYAGGRTLAFMTLRDITERKRAEMALLVLNQTLELEVAARTRELQAALVRAEAADRLKSAFLATMSHELRTPLNSIIGFTGVILQGLAGPLNAEQTKQLGMVRGSARHLLELINDVLDISKIEAGQLEVRAEPFDLRASLERVTGLLKPAADKKGLALTLSHPPEPGELVSDRRRVEQILLNLLNNALKFTDHGGVTLTVETVADYRSSPAAPPCAAVRLRVTDTGLGLKPEDLAVLFQPFRQIDMGIARQHEGTGLGLVICRRLAGLLGGEISVTSEFAKGSEFTVTLPRHLRSPS